jgi:hypothetical protein
VQLLLAFRLIAVWQVFLLALLSFCLWQQVPTCLDHLLEEQPFQHLEFLGLT